MDDLLNVTVFGGVEDSDIDDAILINILNQEKNIFKRFLNYGINYLGFFSPYLKFPVKFRCFFIYYSSVPDLQIKLNCEKLPEYLKFNR